ncbi:unnamed protein product [Protopolystoma xenopodis]|uniref:Uncharacterized protein n=1 Tax=Protopolystoma xenopodis TaxID=117903 RepID=A0A448X005_9PLAT|nr:unnamed protein product [Protopolystoma xenopodis]
MVYDSLLLYFINYLLSDLAALRTASSVCQSCLNSGKSHFKVNSRQDSRPASSGQDSQRRGTQLSETNLAHKARYGTGTGGDATLRDGLGMDECHLICSQSTRSIVRLGQMQPLASCQVMNSTSLSKPFSVLIIPLL